MNIVLLMNDSLRYDQVGAHGNDWIHTPNLDRFAGEAAVFDQAYPGSFPTVPCRHEMMKGRHGDPFQKWGPLQWDGLTVPEVLDLAVSGAFPMCIPPGHRYARALGGAGWTSICVTDPDWFFVDNPETEKRELYPRATDPGQLQNVASAHSEVVEKLHGQLLTFFRRNRAPGWVIKLYRDGPEGIEPPITAMFDEAVFPRGLPFATPLGGNVV